MRIQSNDIVILDTTDSKKIDLHITSNHPTIQIYDQNASQGTLTPDWSTDVLELTPIIYVDSEIVTDDATEFVWTRIKGSGTTEDKVSTSKILRISNNDLDESPIIRYKCTVKYNNKSFFNEITFARVDNGVSAPTVQAQYSVDGTDGTWETALDSTIHKYIHFSYDGGFTWTAPIKIAGEQGEDGRSISLKGTAYTNDELIVGNSIVLHSDEAKQTQITGENSGDSYLVDGYLCVYNGSQFICTGQLQGPKGEDGTTYYLYIRYANDAGGSDFSDTPGNRKYVGFYRSTVTPLPTNIDRSSATWNWAKFAGEDAKSVTLSANAQAFKVDKTNAILPSTITVMAQAINTTIPNSGWTYSTDGKTFVSSVAGVERSGNIVTITGSNMTSDFIVIKAQSGAYMDMFTVYKVSDGADGEVGDKGDPAITTFLSNEHIPFVANSNGQVSGTTATCNVVSYVGTTKTTPTLGVITGLPAGMSIAPNRGTAYTNNVLGTGNIITLYSDSTLNTQVDTTNLSDGDSYVVGTYLCRYNKTNNNFVCENIIVTSNEVKLTITVENNATLGNISSINKSFIVPVINPGSTNLQLNWSKINSGVNGTSASLVDITPSALYFKSTKGKDGEFTPEFIYLYPRFQNATYSNWQYSIDGGVNWASASGANGLAISTYNSIANTLRISRTSTLYTDTVTSISFRCNSATTGVYDTVSVAKIYDVVDLEIGGRNLLLQTDNTEKSTTISNTNGYGVISQFVPSTKTWKAGYVDIAEYGLSIGDTLTFQAYLIPQNNLPIAVRVWGSSNGTSGSPLMNGNFVSTPGVSSCTFTMTHQYLYLAVVTQALPSVTITEKYSNCKLERGHKATDWTPAPEDINTNIKTLTDSMVDIRTTANSAVSRVSETEKSITTINNNISSITNRVSAAEQKITADAIVSTVTKSTTYTSDLGKKVNSTEIISKINQTAETITISASKIGILGATNIPDLTADKIKGGTLTLGGSNATTQNGQLLVKNASDVDMVKLNKDGLVVNSGHLLVSRDFENSRYNWEDESWTTTTNTSQLELADTYLRMGYYTSLGYSPNMVLSNEGLTFQGYGQGVGSWGSYIGHEWDQLNFVIQDTVRSSISFRGADDIEMANLNSYNFDIKVPTVFSGGISYIAIPSSANLNNYKTPGFYRCSLNATAATLTNCPTTYAFSLVVEEHAGVKQTLTVYLTSNHPIIYIRNFYDGAWGQWSRLCYAAENVTLWSGVAGVNTTLTLRENFRDFRYLTCIIGTTTEPFGIVLGSFLDNEVAELHFSSSFTATGGRAGNNTYGAKFTVASGTSVRLVGCGTIELANLSVRKIVGWR